MTPSNLTILNSVREFQKHFNQAFNLAAAALDVTYASTQTISGGLIICRNFTVNSGVVLTISNPTTIICQTFTNNGTITMSPVTENVLGLYRSSDAPRVPVHVAPFQSAVTFQVGATAPSNISTNQAHAGQGGPSFGSGGLAGNGVAAPGAADGDHGTYAGYNNSPMFGWKKLGMAFWWPIAQFRNPVLAQGAGLQFGKSFFSTSLAFQRRGVNGFFFQVTSANAFGIVTTNQTTVGGNPGSFLEVFSRVSSLNAVGATINAIGGGGGAQNSNPNGGGGGGGGVGLYSEGFVSQLGTVNCSGGGGGSSGLANSYGGGGGGGGGIFLTAPTITNSGTNTVAGGAAGTGASGNGQAGEAGVVVAEPYLRLWMPGEDDVVSGTRYAAT